MTITAARLPSCCALLLRRHPLAAAGEQQAAVIQQALQAQAPDGQLLFDSVQATWNLLEQSAGVYRNDVMQLCMVDTFNPMLDGSSV